MITQLFIDVVEECIKKTVEFYIPELWHRLIAKYLECLPENKIIRT